MTSMSSYNSVLSESLSRLSTTSFQTTSVISQCNFNSLEPQSVTITPNTQSGSASHKIRPPTFRFFEEEVQSFELQIQFLESSSKLPDNTLMIVSLMDNPYYRLKCFSLIAKLVDLYPKFIPTLQIIGLNTQVLKILHNVCRKELERHHDQSIIIIRAGCFIMTKILAQSHECLEQFMLKYRQFRANTKDKDHLVTTIASLVKSPKTLIVDRVLYLKLFYLLTQSCVKELFKGDTSKEAVNFTNCTEMCLMNAQLPRYLKAMSQSCDTECRVYSTMLLGNLLQYQIEKQADSQIQDTKSKQLSTELSFQMIYMQPKIVQHQKRKLSSSQIQESKMEAYQAIYNEKPP